MGHETYGRGGSAAPRICISVLCGSEQWASFNGRCNPGETPPPLAQWVGGWVDVKSGTQWHTYCSGVPIAGMKEGSNAAEPAL